MRLFVAVIFSVLCLPALSQPAAENAFLKQKSIAAWRINTEINIDGNLDESVWQEAQRGDNFVEYFPQPGRPMRFKTEVAILYDDEALYIGAWMYDPAPDSILKQLTPRDQTENTDIFGIAIDTYNDDQNDFQFSVTAAGVQTDARESANNYDTDWNAVWLSKVKITAEGWVAEIKIPFSALRFSKDPEQTWGILFSRGIRRYRENGFWSYQNPAISGTANQFGDLTGLKNIKSPLRLALIPYTSGYYIRYDDPSTTTHNGSFSYNAGMDLKYGINEAFTLDMTLVPDFGQVRSDNIVFNTTPYEVRYNEFRQFFTEGTEIFNKSGIFYSRRVGGTPINYGAAYDSLNTGDRLVKNPTSSKTINATKISGRTRSGTGIGFFNGVTARTFAEIEDSLGNSRQVETSPLTNYNLFVVDQNLRNNSYINLTNGSVIRNGNAYDANVTSLSTQLNSKGNVYGIYVQGDLSQRYTPGVDPAFGEHITVSLNKQNGNFTFGPSYDEISDTFNPNDIGYNAFNNKRAYDFTLRYKMFKPKGAFLSAWGGINAYQVRLFIPGVVTQNGIYLWVFANTRKWFTFGSDYEFIPQPYRDYYEPRVAGRYLRKNAAQTFSLFCSTDYRKKVAMDLKLENTFFMNSNWNNTYVRFSPRVRLSDKLSAILSLNTTRSINENASALDRSGSPTILGDTIIFSSRDSWQSENIIEIKYIFTNRMALSFRCRHYWYSLTYKEFYTLEQDGTLGNTGYTGYDISGSSLHDNNFNAFNIDMVYAWVFAPGSEMRVVWKSSIYADLDGDVTGYFNNLSGTLSSGKTNSFSVKFLYYLDAARFQRKKNRN